MMDDIQSAVEAEVGGSFLNSPKTYVGDGVYAFYDGYAIILATMRGCTLHWMALEPGHLHLVTTFLHQIHESNKAREQEP